jgi:hypothetical protein
MATLSGTYNLAGRSHYVIVLQKRLIRKAMQNFGLLRGYAINPENFNYAAFITCAKNSSPQKSGNCSLKYCTFTVDHTQKNKLN